MANINLNLGNQIDNLHDVAALLSMARTAAGDNLELSRVIGMALSQLTGVIDRLDALDTHAATVAMVGKPAPWDGYKPTQPQ